eukprot:1137499-Rhodomonas_salina.2
MLEFESTEGTKAREEPPRNSYNTTVNRVACERPCEGLPAHTRVQYSPGIASPCSPQRRTSDT